MKFKTKYRNKLRKQYGADVFPTKKEAKALGYVPGGISTQSLMLDLAIGRPGLPRGRMFQLMGLDGHGKSTLSHHIIAETQRLGGHATLIDTEDVFDEERAEEIGVNLEDLELVYPRTLEEALCSARDHIREFGKENPTAIHTLILDSLDGRPSSKVQNLAPGESSIARAAADIALLLPEVVNMAARYKCLFVCVSQLSTKIGSGNYRPAHMGPEMETRGGNVPRYRATVRVEIKRGKRLEDKSGFLNRLTIIKNKVAPPFREAIYTMKFVNGIDKLQDLFDGALELGILKERKKSPAGKTRYLFRLRKVKEECTRVTWPALIVKLGGPDKARMKFLAYACRKGLMRPYGQRGEQPIAESDGERSPTGTEEAA